MKAEHTRIVFIYLLLFPLELWAAWLIGRCKKVTSFLSSRCYLCEKKLPFCFFSGGFFCCCFVCFWFFVSFPSLAVTGSSTGGADLKERWYLLKRTSECVSTLFPEACIWCSKIGVHCNLKITKCSLWRSWQESSATKTALFSKGKALIKKKKKIWTNSDMLNMTFFFVCFTHTELLLGFLKIIARLAGRCVETMFFFWNRFELYGEKKWKKYQEDEITIKHILKFVGLVKAGDKVLSCYYLAFC